MVDDKLLLAACRVARYVHSKNYSAVVISGGSNKLSRSLLAIGWKKLFGDLKMPKIFIFPRKVNHLMYKPNNARSIYLDWIREWIAVFLPELNNFKSEQICIVDDYAMTGLKCNEILAMFAALGFEKVDFALFACSRRSELPKQVFVAEKNNTLTRHLCELSLLIQGEPSFNELISGERFSESQRKKIAKQVLSELRNNNNASA